MQKYKLISIDLANHVFQVAAFHQDGTIAFNKKSVVPDCWMLCGSANPLSS